MDQPKAQKKRLYRFFGVVRKDSDDVQKEVSLCTPNPSDMMWAIYAVSEQVLG